MPFTAAHPAAVLPLPKLLGRYSVGSALVAGSMMPDVAVLPLVVDFPRTLTHGLGAVVWLCIPVGLLALGAFHRFVKRPLVLLMPEAMRNRLAPYQAPCWIFPRYRVAAVLVSLGVGALTHIGWDALTHDHGPAVEAMPVLRTTVATVCGYGLPVYKVLQHGSTVLGLLVLSVFVYRWYRSRSFTADEVPTPFSGPARTAIILGLVLLPCAAGTAAGLRVWAGRSGFRAFYAFVGECVIVTLAALVALVLTFGVVFTALEARGTRRPWQSSRS